MPDDPAPPRAGLRGWRARVRTKPGLRWAWKATVFVLGLASVALGLALSVLPGPLTIPPVLLGVWIWSTEFGWARRLVDAALVRARAAWAEARRRPVLATLTTVGGLVAAGVLVWAVYRFDLVAQVRDLLGV